MPSSHTHTHTHSLSLVSPAQVTIRNGFVIPAGSIDLVSTDAAHITYILSSLRLADTARAPQFSSDLSSPFYIGVQSQTQQPLLISPPASAEEVQVVVDLKWCTTNDAFPSSPAASKVTPVDTRVTLAGFRSEAQQPLFTDQGSFIFHTAHRTLVHFACVCARVCVRVCVCLGVLPDHSSHAFLQWFGRCRCIAILSKSTNIPKAVEFVTLEVEVDPAAFNARRSAPIDVADDCVCVCVCVCLCVCVCVGDSVLLFILLSSFPPLPLLLSNCCVQTPRSARADDLHALVPIRALRAAAGRSSDGGRCGWRCDL